MKIITNFSLFKIIVSGLVIVSGLLGLGSIIFNSYLGRKIESSIDKLSSKLNNNNTIVYRLNSDTMKYELVNYSSVSELDNLDIKSNVFEGKYKSLFSLPYFCKDLRLDSSKYSEEDKKFMSYLRSQYKENFKVWRDYYYHNKIFNKNPSNYDLVKFRQDQLSKNQEMESDILRKYDNWKKARSQSNFSVKSIAKVVGTHLGLIGLTIGAERGLNYLFSPDRIVERNLKKKYKSKYSDWLKKNPNTSKIKLSRIKSMYDNKLKRDIDNYYSRKEYIQNAMNDYYENLQKNTHRNYSNISNFSPSSIIGGSFKTLTKSIDSSKIINSSRNTLSKVDSLKNKVSKLENSIKTKTDELGELKSKLTETKTDLSKSTRDASKLKQYVGKVL